MGALQLSRPSVRKGYLAVKPSIFKIKIPFSNNIFQNHEKHFNNHYYFLSIYASESKAVCNNQRFP